MHVYRQNGIVAFRMGKSGYHVLKFHQNMDGVTKVSRFLPLGFYRMGYWYVGCVENFY
jgi:hypothetical protein